MGPSEMRTQDLGIGVNVLDDFDCAVGDGQAVALGFKLQLRGGWCGRQGQTQNGECAGVMVHNLTNKYWGQ